MRTDCFHFCPEAPEWRRSGRFFLLALALHAAVLFAPLRLALGHLEAPPPDKLLVKLVEILPVAPAAPPSESRPPSNAPRQHPVATPRPVLAMAPEQAAPAANWSLPVAAAVPLAAAPAPAAPAATNAPALAQLTPARYDAAYLHNPPPKYPPLSRRLGEEGKVLLKVRVTPEGLPAAVDLEKSSNFERLDEAARQVVSRWRFVPGKRGEEAVEALVIVPVVFRLDE